MLAKEHTRQFETCISSNRAPVVEAFLISGIQLNYKGVFAVAGDRKVALYIKGSSTPFAVGDIQNDLYRLHVEPIIQPVPVMSSLAITPDLTVDLSADPDSSLTPGSSQLLPSSGSSQDDHPCAMNVQGSFDEGVFAIPSLASMYEHPSEVEKQKFFGTV
jgi:hypothetical protein